VSNQCNLILNIPKRTEYSKTLGLFTGKPNFSFGLRGTNTGRTIANSLSGKKSLSVCVSWFILSLHSVDFLFLSRFLQAAILWKLLVLLAEGMYKAGYEDGQRDAKEAASWSRMAADQGNTFVQIFLGRIYGNDGVEQSSKEAASWSQISERRVRTACISSACGLACSIVACFRLHGTEVTVAVLQRMASRIVARFQQHGTELRTWGLRRIAAIYWGSKRAKQPGNVIWCFHPLS